jgi:peptide-methionine (R)-S-oxide reductase
MNELTRRGFVGLAGAGLAAALVIGRRSPAADARTEDFPFKRTDSQWRAILSPAAYEVLRQSGTERAYTSPLDDEQRAGIFACAGCARPLFSSKTKFDSGTGWPSFWAPLAGAVATRDDGSLGVERTEVHCTRCGGHLGHVFEDGPPPTGLRYCLNGVALRFLPGHA